MQSLCRGVEVAVFLFTLYDLGSSAELFYAMPFMMHIFFFFYYVVKYLCSHEFYSWWNFPLTDIFPSFLPLYFAMRPVYQSHKLAVVSWFKCTFAFKWEQGNSPNTFNVATAKKIQWLFREISLLIFFPLWLFCIKKCRYSSHYVNFIGII